MTLEKFGNKNHVNRSSDDDVMLISRSGAVLYVVNGKGMRVFRAGL